MMAFTIQTAMAQDDDLDIDDAVDTAEMDDDFGTDMRRPHPRWRDDGPGFHKRGHHDNWRGGPGHRPDMRPDRDHRMGGKGMRHGMGMFGPRFMEMLQLDDGQKAKIVDVMTENFRQGLLAKMEMADARKKLWDMQESDSTDHDGLIAAHQAVGAAQGKMQVLHRKMRDDVRAVLTPEQLKKLDDFDKRPHRDWDGPKGKDKFKGKDKDKDGKRPQPGFGPREKR